jgi:hypothetical protein
MESALAQEHETDRGRGPRRGLDLDVDVDLDVDGNVDGDVSGLDAKNVLTVALGRAA